METPRALYAFITHFSKKFTFILVLLPNWFMFCPADEIIGCSGQKNILKFLCKLFINTFGTGVRTGVRTGVPAIWK